MHFQYSELLQHEHTLSNSLNLSRLTNEHRFKEPRRLGRRSKPAPPVHTPFNSGTERVVARPRSILPGPGHYDLLNRPNSLNKESKVPLGGLMDRSSLLDTTSTFPGPGHYNPYSKAPSIDKKSPFMGTLVIPRLQQADSHLQTPGPGYYKTPTQKISAFSHMFKPRLQFKRRPVDQPEIVSILKRLTSQNIAVLTKRPSVEKQKPVLKTIRRVESLANRLFDYQDSDLGPGTYDLDRHLQKPWYVSHRNSASFIPAPVSQIKEQDLPGPGSYDLGGLRAAREMSGVFKSKTKRQVVVEEARCGPSLAPTLKPMEPASFHYNIHRQWV